MSFFLDMRSVESPFLVCVILLLSLSSSFSMEVTGWCDSSNRDRIIEYRPRKNSVMIDGVFSVRRQVEVSAHVSACTLDLSRNSSDSIDSFHQYGLEQAQAFIFAIHLANQDASGTTFGYRIRDSCGEIPSQSESCPKPNSLATILGPFWSVYETEDRSRVESLYDRFSGDGTSQLGVVMCGLDREPASGVATPPSVVYLHQSCASQGQAAVEFLLEAKWQSVSVIGSTDSCGVSSVERFYTRAKELKTDCKLSVSYYSVGQFITDKQSLTNSTRDFNLVKLEYDDVPNYLLRDVPTDSRLAVVLLTNTETAFTVLRQMKMQKVDMSQFVFVFGDFWGNPDTQQRLNRVMLDYLPVSAETTSVKLQQYQKGIEMFQDYMTGLKPYSTAFQRNKWLKEYLEGFYNCSIANRTCIDSDTWPTTKRNLFRNHHTSLIIDGVLAVAEYCKAANCDVRDGAQPRFDVKRFHPDFISWTGNRVRYGPVDIVSGDTVTPLSWRYDFLRFGPTSDRSGFNITNLGHWKRQGDEYTLNVQTSELWKPFSYVFGRDCFPKPSLFLLFLPSLVAILTIAVSCGLCFYKGMLPATLKVAYTDVVAVVSSLSGLILSILVVLGSLPIGDCEDLAVDFAVTVICTACFASVLITILCHRWNWCNIWVITGSSRFRTLRYVSPAAIVLAVTAVQVALSAYSCIVVSPIRAVTLDIDSACAFTRNHATFHVTYVYSAVVCILCALASLLPPIQSQNYPFRYHTLFSRISLFTLSILFGSLVTSYLVVDSYAIHLSLLTALAVFPGLFISVAGVAIFLHVRWCYVHFATTSPIIIELIDPLMERTADVFPNKYASTTLSVSLDDNPRCSTISRFPFQLRDQDLINQVRPVFINPDRIAIGEYIGGGNFGQVFNGTLDETTGVALKTLRGSFTAEELEDFLKEGLRMKDFDHPNVMQLIGIGYGKVAVNQNPESSVDVMPVVVLPYMEMGDLKRYLTEGRPGRARHHDYFPVPLLDRLHMALQIAKGMDYLASHRIVHRDLAARNCMVDSGRQVRVGDFGLARVVDGICYRQKRSICMPFMWMSIESLLERTFSTSSDVWSYGVTLWEIMTYGQRPYRCINNSNALVEFLSRGKRLPQPDHCSSKIYSLMTTCWMTESQERPSFPALVQELEEHMSSSLGYDLASRESTLDKEETSFNGLSDPRYIGLYKVPRPVESNGDEDWWKQSEMAAGERQASSQMAGSPPHYVNENIEDGEDNVNDCQSNGVPLSEAEAPDYVNAAATEAPYEYDSLEKAPSATKLDGTDSMDDYVKLDSHLANGKRMVSEVAEAESQEEVSLTMTKSPSHHAKDMNKEDTVCPLNVVSEGGNKADRANKIIEDVNGTVKVRRESEDTLTDSNAIDPTLDVHVDASDVCQNNISNCAEVTDLATSVLPVKEYVVVTVHESGDEGETSC